MTDAEMKDPETNEQRQDRRREHGQRAIRKPFDTSELNTIPTATDDDPPYRNWWVVVDPTSR